MKTAIKYAAALVVIMTIPIWVPPILFCGLVKLVKEELFGYD